MPLPLSLPTAPPLLPPPHEQAARGPKKQASLQARARTA